jgi:uncharacterized protein with ParB-like and HNH nuclease domain
MLEQEVTEENEKDFHFDSEETKDNEDTQINEYDLTSTPNDFNILTINSFLDSGAIVIPGFQRNYVWDIKRASKLIESIILGLPVPQVFLYEEKRNKFLVIDGQQRLLTIFYFIKQRFPRKDKRTQLRKIFIEHGSIPDDVLHNDDYFTSFKLSLPKKSNGDENIFNKMSYKTLMDFKTQFELRPLRNIIVKQNYPTNDNSSVYEIFNRLNSGGMNLRPQEIRSSLYHSKFIELIHRLNLNESWRRVIRLEDPDLHMKDVELLFRGFSFMLDGLNYKPSLASFLNKFAQKAKEYDIEKISYLEKLFVSLIENIIHFPTDAFINPKTKRFNTFLFESLLYCVGRKYADSSLLVTNHINYDTILTLSQDAEFLSSSIAGTTNSDSVEKRFERAIAIIR